MSQSYLKRLALQLFCELWCSCKPPLPKVKISFGPYSFTLHGDIMSTVPDTGGPFAAEITAFVDAKSNPTTDTDVPVWGTSDATIATATPDAVNPQKAAVALTGKTGQVQITATFGDVAAGGFVVTGQLDVQPGAAVSATMSITGSGLSTPVTPTPVGPA